MRLGHRKHLRRKLQRVHENRVNPNPRCACRCCRGSLRPTAERSVRGSTLWRIAARAAAHAVDPSMPQPAPGPERRRAQRSGQPISPGYRRAKRHRSRASPAWDGAPLDRRVIVPWSHGSRGRHLGSQRYAAARAIRSTRRDPDAGQSRVRRVPGREEAQSPRVPPEQDTAWKAALPKASILLVACRPPPETIVSRQPVTHRPRSPLPRSRGPSLSPPRTVAGHRVRQPTADQATATVVAQAYRAAASVQSSQPRLTRCCDDGLNPPSSPARRSPASYTARRSRSSWTAEARGATTRSPCACGARSDATRFTCGRTDRSAKRAPRSVGI